MKETCGYIDRSLIPALGTRRLSKLKPADLDAFYRQLLASHTALGAPLLNLDHSDIAKAADRSSDVERRPVTVGHLERRIMPAMCGWSASV